MLKIFIWLLFFKVFAADQDLASRLKQDLQHDAERKKAFSRYNDEKQKNEKERDKGLALYLEEQEQWEMAREKTVHEYKRSRKKPLDENSPEFFADEALKKQREKEMDVARKKHIQEKADIIAQYSSPHQLAEEQELQIYSHRPRYDVRKRENNKWTKSGKGLGGSSGSSSGGTNFGGSDNGFDLPIPPPPGDFNTTFPADSFDDFPPPPGYDGNMPGSYDSGFGDGMMAPQVPPPMQDGFDF